MSTRAFHTPSRAVAWTIAVALMATAAPRAVEAQAAASEATDEFSAGVSALREGRNEDAARLLAAAYEHTQRPVALLNLGIAYTRLGRIELAVNALTQYVSEADPTRDALNIQAVRTELQRLQALQVSTDSDSRAAPAPATTVSRDAEQVARATPPPAEAPTELEEAPEPAAEPDTEGACSLGTVCLGPVLALGLPNLVGGGLLVRMGDYAALGASFQMLPTVPILDLGSLSATLFTVEARVHPFGGVFFMAIGAAHQAVSAKAATAEISAVASAGMPALHLGLGFIGRDGAVLGIDLALLLPLTRTSVSVDTVSAPATGVEAAVIADVERTAKRRAQDFVDLMPLLVQLNVLRLGLLF